MRKLFNEPSPGVLGEESGHCHGQKQRSKSITFSFFGPNYFGQWYSWNHFAMISTVRGRLRLGSVAAALMDSPQQSADSTWGETCLLLLTVQTHQKIRRGQTGVWVASSHGLLFRVSDRGFVCRKFLWAYSFCYQWRVSAGEYASRYGRNQNIGCVAYESRIHTIHAWNLPKLSGQNFNGKIGQVVIWVQNLTHFISEKQFWKRVFLCNPSWNFQIFVG